MVSGCTFLASAALVACLRCHIAVHSHVNSRVPSWFLYRLDIFCPFFLLRLTDLFCNIEKNGLSLHLSCLNNTLIFARLNRIATGDFGMAKARTRNGQGKETKQLQAEPKEEFSGKEKGPQELLLDLIDEDPNQPRVIFDPQLLEELATTIGRRGVKNPISVRQTTDKPDRYIINDGARRTRASRMAGKKTIPAFIDQDFTKIDQIIVNAQHADFTPREWALLIDQEREEREGKTADRGGIWKNPAFRHLLQQSLETPRVASRCFQ